MSRPKIVMIGAGSTVFAKNLLGDILSYPELAQCRLTLFDIDEERLRDSVAVAQRVATTLGAAPTLESTTDRARALDGADYAINMVQVGGYRPCTVTDFELPRRYGLRQTIGDTLGIAGIMRALRTIPVLLEMARDMERLCPEVVHLNYVNPMAMNCWALSRATRIRTVGLCHSVPLTARALAEDLEVPPEELEYLVAGINHLAFFLRIEHRGVDLYPRLRRIIAEGRVRATDRVRYEMIARLGYFPTESSEHFSEYVPWFIKRGREDLIRRFHIPLDEYPRRCEEQIATWRELRARLQDPSVPLEVQRSVEYGAIIISAIETGEPARVYANVVNAGLIDNLPRECVVEVPCLVDRNGVQPVRLGRLPAQLAAVMQTNVNVQALTVEAVLGLRRDHVYHAAMLDPHTAAELDLDEIHALVDELLEAHAAWIPSEITGTRPTESTGPPEGNLPRPASTA
jgi:alpha-galactosidase